MDIIGSNLSIYSLFYLKVDDNHKLFKEDIAMGNNYVHKRLEGFNNHTYY